MNGIMLSLTAVDQRLLCAFIARRRRLGKLAMRWITKLGNPTVVIPLTLALAFLAEGAVSSAGGVAAWSLAVSHLTVHVVKHAVTRPRPSLPGGLSWLIEPEDRFSFPSGHATAGLSVGLPILIFVGGVVGAVALVLGLLVGVSRCYLGVHYPFDVLAGWSLAVATVGGVLLMGIW
ncbi:MAG: phosphatase PAP2 family protein [Gemmatimonadota bacterium]